jgi:hypothetical protein
LTIRTFRANLAEALCKILIGSEEMAKKLSEDEIYEQAKKRVEEKKGFFIHFTVYIIVNIILVLIWAFAADRGFPWFVFPLGGWGIGLLFHYLEVFVFENLSNRAAIEKEAERIKREQS